MIKMIKENNMIILNSLEKCRGKWTRSSGREKSIIDYIMLGEEDENGVAPNDTAYKRWSCHSGFKLLCKLCRTSPPDLPFFGHAGHADPLDGWRCCSQKRVMSRPIQVR